MAHELNLTEDQRRRIENAQTPEEKAAVFAEAVGDGRELSEEEVDAVTGGDAHRIPPTHEEIDRAWNTIQTVQDKYGVSVANYMAYEMHLIPDDTLDGSGQSCLSSHTISQLRYRMHAQLDGTLDSLSSTWGY